MRRFRVLFFSLLSAFAFALGVAAPQSADAHRPVTLDDYYGAPPVPEPLSGWCEEDGLHVHTYMLDEDEYSVEDIDGVLYFVGDPVLWGWAGTTHWYYDPHPVGAWGIHGWCVLDGPHSHWFAPHWHAPRYDAHTWVTWDGFVVYVGVYDPWYDYWWERSYPRRWRSHSSRYDRWYGHDHRRDHPARRYFDGSHSEPRINGWQRRRRVDHRGQSSPRGADHGDNRGREDGSRNRGGEARDDSRNGEGRGHHGQDSGSARRSDGVAGPRSGESTTRTEPTTRERDDRSGEPVAAPRPQRDDPKRADSTASGTRNERPRGQESTQKEAPRASQNPPAPSERRSGSQEKSPPRRETKSSSGTQEKKVKSEGRSSEPKKSKKSDSSKSKDKGEPKKDKERR